MRISDWSSDVCSSDLAVLFTAADLETDPDPTPGDNKDGDTSFDLVALNGDAPISGARTIEVIITEVGTRLYPGLSEIDIWGDGVPTLFRPRLKWNDDTQIGRAHV